MSTPPSYRVNCPAVAINNVDHPQGSIITGPLPPGAQWLLTDGHITETSTE